MSTYTPILVAIQAALVVVDQKGQKAMIDSFAAIASNDDAKLREISAIGKGLVAQHDFLLRLEKDLKTAVMIEKLASDPKGASPEDTKSITDLLVAEIIAALGSSKKTRSPEEEMEHQIDAMMKDMSAMMKDMSAMMKDMSAKGIGVMRIDPSELFKDAAFTEAALGAGASVGGGAADFRTQDKDPNAAAKNNIGGGICG